MKTLLIFSIGFVLGLFATGIVIASAPRIIGGSGFLMGVEVKDDDGNTICSDPYFWSGINEIECD